jgi:hypothetical protein
MQALGYWQTSMRFRARLRHPHLDESFPSAIPAGHNEFVGQLLLGAQKLVKRFNAIICRYARVLVQLPGKLSNTYVTLPQHLRTRHIFGRKRERISTRNTQVCDCVQDEICHGR